MKQKLLIFFSIGLLIFVIDVLFNKDSTNKITIYESELDSLIDTWIIQVGRDPTVEEIDGIIKQLIDEEILYREALKLGLDKNDIIIKRRLAQKISFLKQESIDKSPSEEDIQISADLAALFSKAKMNIKVPISLVNIKDLKKYRIIFF